MYIVQLFYRREKTWTAAVTEKKMPNQVIFFKGLKPLYHKTEQLKSQMMKALGKINTLTLSK